MNTRLAAAIAAVKAFGARAIAAAEGAAQPELQQLHDDAVGSLEQIEQDGEAVAEATAESFLAKSLTPALGAAGAASAANIYARGGEAALASALKLPAPPAGSGQ